MPVRAAIATPAAALISPLSTSGRPHPVSTPATFPTASGNRTLEKVAVVSPYRTTPLISGRGGGRPEVSEKESARGSSEAPKLPSPSRTSSRVGYPTDFVSPSPQTPKDAFQRPPGVAPTARQRAFLSDGCAGGKHTGIETLSVFGRNGRAWTVVVKRVDGSCRTTVNLAPFSLVAPLVLPTFSSRGVRTRTGHVAGSVDRLHTLKIERLSFDFQGCSVSLTDDYRPPRTART